MMTQQLGVSILAAPLAAIDRRALSQAWYSALRFSPPAQPALNVRACTARLCALDGGQRIECGSRTPRNARRELQAVRIARNTPAAIHADGEALARRRRAPGSPLAVRIERTFAERSYPKRATFSLGRGGARVHVILQSTGERTTLIALCRPELRVVVSRALTQARTALAARGISLELRAFGGRGCS